MSFSIDLSANLAASAIWAGSAAATAWFVHWSSTDSRLTGRWEGDLTCDGSTAPHFRTHVIRCVLVLARPKARNTSGLLYYTRECTTTDKKLVRGVDELADYSCSGQTLKQVDFVLSFIRRFHKHPNGKLDYNSPSYDFNMNLAGRFARHPKLHVKTRIPNGALFDDWSGTFQRV